MDVTSGAAGVLAGAVLGAVVGLALTVAFEDQLKFTIRQRLRRRKLNATTDLLRATRHSFAMGPLKTTCVILEGDGESPIKEESIDVIVDHAMVKLPAEMAQWREELASELDRKRKSGASPHWNGPNYAVSGFTISRHPTTEEPEICIRLQYSDYYNFLASQQLDRRFGDGSTPRSRYVEPFDLDAVPAFMSSAFGTNVAVVTADGRLLVSRRSKNVGSLPGLWSSSANEALSRSIDSKGRQVPNLYEVARRGVREELAIEPNEYRLDMLAFCVDTERNQWGGLYIARLHNLSQIALEERWGRGVADRWEHVEHRFVPFNATSVISFILDPNRINKWTPAGPTLYFLALVNEFGRARVERAIADISRRLARENS